MTTAAFRLRATTHPVLLHKGCNNPLQSIYPYTQHVCFASYTACHPVLQNFTNNTLGTVIALSGGGGGEGGDAGDTDAQV